MPRGGPRPNTGGRREGSGRKPLPRLSPAETAAALDPLAPDRAELARRLGVSAEAVRAAYRNGATESQVAAWVGRLTTTA